MNIKFVSARCVLRCLHFREWNLDGCRQAYQRRDDEGRLSELFSIGDHNLTSLQSGHTWTLIRLLYHTEKAGEHLLGIHHCHLNYPTTSSYYLRNGDDVDYFLVDVVPQIQDFCSISVGFADCFYHLLYLQERIGVVVYNAVGCNELRESLSPI